MAFCGKIVLSGDNAMDKSKNNELEKLNSRSAKRYVTSEMIVSALKECQKKYGHVSCKNLREVDSGVYYYLSKLASMRKAKGEETGLWDIATEYVPDVDGKPQIEVQKKVNYKEYTIQSLVECQKKYNKVNLIDLKNEWPKAYAYVAHAVGAVNSKCKDGHKVKMTDICKKLVPSITIEETYVFDTEEKVVKALEAFADEDGAVDGYRANKILYNAVNRFSSRAGVNYPEWIEEKSKEILGRSLYVTFYMADTNDLIEEHRKRIAKVYGDHGVLDGISVDHPDLYLSLRIIREHLGGKAYTMKEAAEAVGFEFESGDEEPTTKIDERYTAKLLWKTYPDGVVRNLKDNTEVLYSVTALARIKGCELGEIIESHGLTYDRGRGEGRGKGKGKSEIKKIMVRRNAPEQECEESEA